MEFTMNELIDELKRRGFEAREIDTVKNGVKKHGIVVKIGDGSVCPIFYADDMKHFPMQEVVNKIVSALPSIEEKSKTPFLEMISDWDYVKDHIILCLQHGSTEGVFKWNLFGDLELFLRIKLCEDPDSLVSVKVRNEYLAFWGIDPDTLYSVALENTVKETEILTMAEKLGADFPGMDDMVIITNKSGINGAACIVDDHVTEYLEKKFGSEYVLLPNSIHEWLAVAYDPDGDYDGMVRDSNMSDAVDPDLVLSDHAYHIKDREVVKREGIA